MNLKPTPPVRTKWRARGCFTIRLICVELPQGASGSGKADGSPFHMKRMANLVPVSSQMRLHDEGPLVLRSPIVGKKKSLPRAKENRHLTPNDEDKQSYAHRPSDAGYHDSSR